MRVAIVGLGPKGLFALERLLHHAAGAPGFDLDVDAYEPSRVPGAGPVYAPDQPGYLRMNFRSEQVNLWPPGSRAIATADQMSFARWRGPADDPYAPRAQVGRYLAEGLDRLRRQSPENARIRIIGSRVTRLRQLPGRWEVQAQNGSDSYDEVLIATGHEQQSDDALACSWRSPAPLIPSVFPIETYLGERSVPAGSVVAARGFALSFIDAALALTEGRGGRFERLADNRLRYTPGDSEVGRLVPYSRTGRPMLAKPAQPENLDHPVLRVARERILGLPCGFTVREDLLAIIGDVVSASGSDQRPLIAETLIRSCDETPAVTSLTAQDEMRRSVEIAVGMADPDLPSLFGFAWRGVYPALVERFGGRGLGTSEWPAFRRLSVNMERLAFGPSPTNLMKLLALIDAGKVDLGALQVASWRDIQPLDAVIDTVLAAPGVGRSPLLRRLLADGYARTATNRRGLEVTPDGACVGQDGTVTEGLYAIGRPTEDSVIGNDTLSRTLHPAADLWARRILSQGSAAALQEAVV